MRHSAIFSSAALVLAAACVKDPSGPAAPPTFRLTATVTEANDCDVTTLDKTYSSKGQVRGDVPALFVGTIPDKSYHGLGCWVATNGGDGDLIIIFSGNNFGKPLAVGTYAQRLDILDDSPPNVANVVFRTSSLGSDYLTTMDGSGTVVVDSTASGGRRIQADVQVVRWRTTF